MNEQQLEEYWNNKHPKIPIIYGGREIPNHEGKVSIDVRKMFWSEDYMLADIITKNNLVGETMDETIWRCQKYVVSKIKYISDIENTKYNEYWQFCNETEFLQVGDCEDGALLLASLATSAGVPLWRVRVNAGWVLDKNGQQQGHAYVTFCREKNNNQENDNNWVILDWCFLQDSDVSVNEKPLAKNNDKYCDLWFSFNSQYSWSYKRYDIFEDINEEPKTLFNGI